MKGIVLEKYLSSYIEITTINTAEDTCKYVENFPDILIKNCMLFIMRKGINPYWEDPQNIKGGCFSYKVSNKIVVQCWKNLSYLLLGETLTNANIYVVISEAYRFFEGGMGWPGYPLLPPP